MAEPNTRVLDFLRTRRSRPTRLLGLPVPSRDEVGELLTIAARSPDHGKLEPWRFLVYDHAACQTLAEAIGKRGLEAGLRPERVEMSQNLYRKTHLVIGVVSSPKPSDGVPESEQILSAGAVCLALLNGALAMGYGANWISGWISHDRPFLRDTMGLADHETMAGLVFMGTATEAPSERPRPDVEALTTWVGA
ncbi:MAG: nitroreductase [Pseudomonadota bacterium]